MLGLKNKTAIPLAKLSMGGYQSVIDYVFRPMNLGQLTIELPDGARMIYGSGAYGPNAIIKINNRDFFKKCTWYGDVGFGESFVDGDWDTPDLTAVIDWMITNVEGNPILMDDQPKTSPVNFLKIINKCKHALRQNSRTGSRKNIADHYDLGNEFFRIFLDPTMAYSSAYFIHEKETLHQAQLNKYERLCQRLKIHSADHVLEIGSGWGGLAFHAARNYGCKVTTITISKEQYDYVQRRVNEEGLAAYVNVRFQDYRDVRGQFDKIVSVEMIEAVGHRYLKAFFSQCHKLLKKDGLLALQMILSPDHRYESFRKNVDWIQKHIFPGSLLPSMQVIHNAIRQTGNLMLYDFKDITPSYAQTLRIWREKFNKNLALVRAMGFDESFIRKWNYYKCYCEAAFKTRNISVAQAVFLRPNNRAV